MSLESKRRVSEREDELTFLSTESFFSYLSSDSRIYFSTLHRTSEGLDRARGVWWAWNDGLREFEARLKALEVEASS